MEVILYSADWCPWCQRTKMFLKENKIKFKEVNVDKDPNAARELIEKTGQMGIPVTLVDGKPIIGYDVPRLKQALKLK
ncbi:MAG: glutaredoxin family protein [Candidatus Aenigmarchaeota archaeon]|jgi:glutaredoxin 3|nr:glutaredoxin family protein [Candidatus Aenigmarchaeota archaeon]MBU5689281.1 glutaredoxin family protein [Candidatus Aenigmarchaeota archaeon]